MLPSPYTGTLGKASNYPNRSAVNECKSLGERLKMSIIKAVSGAYNSLGIYAIIVYMVRGTTWTFVQKEVEICTCADVRQPNVPEYRSNFYLFLMSF